MPREAQATEPYRERLLKLSPTETVGVCLAAMSMVSAMDPGTLQTALLWVIFGVGLVATPFWLIYKMEVKKPLQVVVASIAFIVYFMTIEGGPFATIPGYNLMIGAMGLILFTGLVAPLLGKIE